MAEVPGAGDTQSVPGRAPKPPCPSAMPGHTVALKSCSQKSVGVRKGAHGTFHAPPQNGLGPRETGNKRTSASEKGRPGQTHSLPYQPTCAAPNPNPGGYEGGNKKILIDNEFPVQGCRNNYIKLTANRPLATHAGAAIQRQGIRKLF